MRGIKGRVALVTGAARGQGEAHVRRLVEEGCLVVATDVLLEEGRSLAEQLGDAVRFVAHDVSIESEWSRAVEVAVQEFGQLNILVNNAGVAMSAPLLETRLEDYLHVIGVNQIGVFLGMKTVAAAMQRSGGGSIINISSIDGMVGMANVVAYVASKFAVRGMTKGAALELGALGIRVNSIHPGAIDTAMIRPPGLESVDYDSMFKHLPMARCGRVDDVSGVVAFLASDESAYITGTEIVIDGGLLAGVNLTSV